MGLLLLCIPLLTSCNNEWEDEQYEQYVSFKAPLDTEGSSVGVTTIHVPYTRIDESGNPRYGAAGVSSYELPVIVSGSTHNNRNLTVHIAHDPDTLDILNYERFNYRKELYYNDMNAYATYEPTLEIRKGDDITLFHIGLDFRGIDLADKWVLPLTIEDKDASGNSYGYERNPRKNYAKAMLRILPYTDYSGQYIDTNLKFYIQSGGVTDAEPGSMSSVQLYAVDEQTCFFYAGTFNESSLDRRSYKVFAKFTPTPANPRRGSVTLTSDNPEIGLIQHKEATFTILEQFDEVQTYILRRTVVINDLDYTFTDYTSARGSRVDYLVQGTMTMERRLNTQMPEEDQIIW